MWARGGGIVRMRCGQEVTEASGTVEGNTSKAVVWQQYIH